MCWVTDFIECSDEIVGPVLLQGDAYVQDMVSGCRAVTLPSLGNLVPRVLDLEVVPSLGYERVRRRERDEGEDGDGEPNHVEEEVVGSTLSIVDGERTLYRA